MPSGIGPAVDNSPSVPIALSSQPCCHCCLHTPAESVGHNVTQLSKSTVPVQQERRPFVWLFGYTPSSLKLNTQM